MAHPSDAHRILNESELVELANVKRPRRAAWAKLGYLRAAARGEKYGELDAVELVTFLSLVKSLDFDDAVLAWEVIRHGLGEVALAGGLVLVLFDHQAKTATLAPDPESLGLALRPDHLFQLVDVSREVREARDAYRRMKQSRRVRRSSPSESPSAVRRLESP